jgi:prepilin-type processing-associated H-X9-DG protein
VGIAGATADHDFTETRLNDTANWCCEASARDGWISGGGMLVPNQSLALVDARDGSSCTLIVGECSDWMLDSDDQKHRVDGGWPYGWMIGCSGPGSPPAYAGDRVFNITTISSSPNNFAYGAPGIAADHGPNGGLLSAHGEGFNALYVDGHARYYSYDMDRTTLKRLATRDDGGVMTDY